MNTLLVTVLSPSGAGGSSNIKYVSDNLVKKEYSVKILSTGEFFKEKSKLEEISLINFLKNLENDIERERGYDIEFKAILSKNLEEQKWNVIFLDSKIPSIHVGDYNNVFKVFIDASEEDRAIGSLKREQRGDYSKKNIEEQVKTNKKIVETDALRYKKLYGVSNFLDKQGFDLVFSTSDYKALKESGQFFLEKILKQLN